MGFAAETFIATVKQRDEATSDKLYTFRKECWILSATMIRKLERSPLGSLVLKYVGDSGEKSPRMIFRSFWDFLKEEKGFLPFFYSNVLYCSSKCDLYFQSLLICWVLIASLKCLTQQWFCINSTFESLNTSKATLFTQLSKSFFN